MLPITVGKGEAVIPFDSYQEVETLVPIPPGEIARKVAERFGAGSVMMDIARCESQYRQYDKDGNVLRGKANPDDVGIFQVNEHYHLADSKARGDDIYTTDGNIDYAAHLLETQGTKPWNWSKGCWGK